MSERIASFALDGSDKRGPEALVEAAVMCAAAAGLLVAALPTSARAAVLAVIREKLPEVVESRAKELEPTR